MSEKLNKFQGYHNLSIARLDASAADLASTDATQSVQVQEVDPNNPAPAASADTTPVDQSAPAAAPAPEEGGEDVSETIVSEEDAAELTATSIDIDNGCKEMENMQSAQTDLENQQEAVGKVLETPEAVTPQLTTIATNSYNMILKRLNMDLSILPNIGRVSQEAIETNPYQVLSTVHQDVKGVMSTIGGAIKTAWEWVVKQLKKLWELIRNFTGNIVNRLNKLKDKLLRKKQSLQNNGGN